MTREYRFVIREVYPPSKEGKDGNKYFCYFQIADYVAPGTGEAQREYPEMTFGATKLDALNVMIQKVRSELEKDDQAPLTE
jgi:hypothetical protein